MHPKLFSGVARQLCRPGGGELQSVESVVVTLATVSRDLFRADITWSKVSNLQASVFLKIYKQIVFADSRSICAGCWPLSRLRSTKSSRIFT